MEKILVSNLTEGMILQEDVKTRSGRVITFAGMMITNEMIRDFKKASVKHVYVSTGLTDVSIDGLAQSDEGTEVSFMSEDVKVTFHEKTQKEVEEKTEKLSKIVKESIINLNMNKEEYSKNCADATNFIKDNFVKNTGNALNSILTIRDVDEYLYRHSMNVSILSFMIGRWMGYDDKRLDKLVKAALLHDIGKLKIPDEVINKPGKLTDEEFEIMKKHSRYTYDFLMEKGETDIEIIQGAVFHHEKIDGSGYPSGISGNKVHEFARIISVADIFDAMTSKRVYKEKVSIFKVLELFEAEAFGTLDPKIIRLLVERFLKSYIGATVVLNDGSSAKIVKLNVTEIMKPLVMKPKGEFVDMSKYRSIKIEDFLFQNGQPVFK